MMNEEFPKNQIVQLILNDGSEWDRAYGIVDEVSPDYIWIYSVAVPHTRFCCESNNARNILRKI